MDFCPPGGQNSASPRLFLGVHHFFWFAQVHVHTTLFGIHHSFLGTSQDQRLPLDSNPGFVTIERTTVSGVNQYVYLHQFYSRHL